MGCGSSKLPAFPPPSLADWVLPLNPPDDSFQAVKIIPQPGMLGRHVAIYLPNDIDHPSFFISPFGKSFFSPNGGSYKCFRYVRVFDGTNEEVAEIKQDWQSLKTQQDLEAVGFEGGSLLHTAGAKKTLTVLRKINGMEDSSVKVHKLFDLNGLSTCEISNGYAIKEDETNRCETMYLDGNVIAYIFDKAVAMGGNGMVGQRGIGGGDDMMKYWKCPVGVYIKRDISETEMIRALTIIATANDRLIHDACVNIAGFGDDPFGSKDR